MQKLKLLLVISFLSAIVVSGWVKATAPSAAKPHSPIPTGRTIIVSSTDDDGPETLRQALLDAQPGDTITFDPAVFPPHAPETIVITSQLPQISQGHLTIDASDAGVILDGSQLPEDTWLPGLEIVSDGNTIRGLQVINFTGTGIVVAFHGRNNTIGGDRNIGVGPTGQAGVEQVVARGSIGAKLAELDPVALPAAHGLGQAEPDNLVGRGP